LFATAFHSANDSNFDYSALDFRKNLFLLILTQCSLNFVLHCSGYFLFARAFHSANFDYSALDFRRNLFLLILTQGSLGFVLHSGDIFCSQGRFTQQMIKTLIIRRLILGEIYFY